MKENQHEGLKVGLQRLSTKKDELKLKEQYY
jgi:hypothetical protein